MTGSTGSDQGLPTGSATVADPLSLQIGLFSSVYAGGLPSATIFTLADPPSKPGSNSYKRGIWELMERDTKPRPHNTCLSKSGGCGKSLSLQRLELDQQLADHFPNPDDVVPWEQVKSEALARFKQ